MKLISYNLNGNSRLGLFTASGVYDLHRCDKRIPNNMASFLEGGERFMTLALEVEENVNKQIDSAARVMVSTFAAPVPQPSSLRDAYAFRQHVETSRLNRGLPMIAAFDEFPVFYFSNHRAIYGEGIIFCEQDHFNRLDFELEVAVVLNKKGRNIRAYEADDYIAGYMIMNDFSARAIQMEEMQLSLGPAKGKDFATAIGPWLVTADELRSYLIETPSGHVGNVYALGMTAKINDDIVSTGNLATMHWTFAEILERCSYGVDLFPGDVIGSGTVGTGCLLELNGTGRRQDAFYNERWLQPGDAVTLEVEGLGSLKNVVLKQQNDVRIFRHVGG